MSGVRSDLPDGLVADDAALPAGEGEDLTLGSILGEDAAAPVPQTVHERMAQRFQSFAPPADPESRTVAYFDDAPALVRAWVRERTGRDLGTSPTWVRFVRRNLQKGALCVIHNPHACGEAELLVVADRGVISRSMIRDVCRWAFYGLGLWRVVLRVPENCADLSDLAQRAKFRFEGTSRLFFGGVVDAHVWAMAGPDCPWLPRLSCAPPVADISPPSSLKVH